MGWDDETWGNVQSGEAPTPNEMRMEQIRLLQSMDSKLRWQVGFNGIRFFVELSFIAVMIWFIFVVLAHKDTMEDILDEAREIVHILKDAGNYTIYSLRDVVDTYERARDKRQIRLQNLRSTYGDFDGGGPEPVISSNDDDNYINTEPSGNEPLDPTKNPDRLEALSEEGIAATLTRIILNVIPLHNEELLEAKLTRVMNGFDSGMVMLTQALNASLVPNTARLEGNINDVLEKEQTKKAYDKITNMVSLGSDNKEGIYKEYQAVKNKTQQTIDRLNILAKSPLVTRVLYDEQTLEDLVSLAKAADLFLENAVKYSKTDTAHELAEGTDKIIQSINDFHTIRHVSDMFNLLYHFAARTLEDPSGTLDDLTLPQDSDKKRDDPLLPMSKEDREDMIEFSQEKELDRVEAENLRRKAHVNIPSSSYSSSSPVDTETTPTSEVTMSRQQRRRTRTSSARGNPRK